jgi:fructose-1,6-bisphosphatase/inositol monophosphatase family enzyme
MPWDTAAGWLLVEEAGGRVTILKAQFLPAVSSPPGLQRPDPRAMAQRLLSDPHYQGAL